MKKKLALFTVLCFLLGLTAGCSDTGSTAVSKEPTAAVETAEPETVSPEEVQERPAQPESSAAEPAEEILREEAEAEPEIPAIQYPLNTDTTLTFCTKFVANDCSDLAPSTQESAVWKAAEAATGVHIEVTEINAWTYNDQFSLMLASGETTDMMLGFIGAYSTGIDSAVDEGMIVDISDYLDLCPDYASLISREEFRQDVTTDRGTIGAFYGLDESEVSVSFGFYVRQDYLDRVGLAVPVTVEDTAEVLEAFKTELGLKYPLYIGANNIPASLTGAWDIPSLSSMKLMQVNGQVTTAPFMDGFDEAISTLTNWYARGLISSDFIDINGNFIFLPETYVTAVTSGTAGLFPGGTSTVDSLEAAGTAASESWAVTAIPAPVKEQGQTIHAGEDPLSRLSGDHVSISADCQDIELAVQWCNYFYTADGSLLASYGIEGESFEYTDDGQPRLLEYAFTGDDQYTKGQKNMNWLSFPFGLYMADRSAASHSQHYYEALEAWNSNLDHGYYLPNTYSLTPGESEEYNSIAIDISTVMSEYILKFITGSEPLDRLEDFRRQLTDMGYDRMLEIIQGAYDRYLERS